MNKISRNPSVMLLVIIALIPYPQLDFSFFLIDCKGFNQTFEKIIQLKGFRHGGA